MNQGDLFASRVRVAMADLTAGVSGFNSIDRPELAQLCSMTAVQDVPPDASRTIYGLPEARNQLELQGLVLKAFWEAFSGLLELRSVPARLLVNPPKGVAHPGLEGIRMTLSTQDWLAGAYGIRGKSALPRDVAFKVTGETSTYFDDVAVFWDHEIDAESLAGWIIPGSTLTLCRPRPDTHAEWIRWVGLDFGFSKIIDAFESKFKLQLVGRHVVGQVEHSIIGVEAK